MAKIAIAFLTKDRVELSKQSILPLRHAESEQHQIDIFWIDGSKTIEGERLPDQYLKSGIDVHHNVRGGADAAVAYALTAMLNSPNDYDFVGTLENDVLLPNDWFGPTFALFERGKKEGLHVGSVSARAYEDRILIQRDGYSVMHNLGFGMQIMRRQAAATALRYMRTGLTRENRIIFANLTNLDIGQYWAFRFGDHPIVADWHQDALLASYGYASLALTPSDVEMIGQDPPLHQQGLKIAKEPVELLRDDDRFELFAYRMQEIRNLNLSHMRQPWIAQRSDDMAWAYIFPHHLRHLGARFEGKWSLKWVQGMGPFSWMAQEKGAKILIPVAGPWDMWVSGGKKGGRIEVRDTHTKLRVAPDIPPDGSPAINGKMTILKGPSPICYRTVEITAHDPGVCFHALMVRDEQVYRDGYDFSWDELPPFVE